MQHHSRSIAIEQLRQNFGARAVQGGRQRTFAIGPDLNVRQIAEVASGGVIGPVLLAMGVQMPARSRKTLGLAAPDRVQMDAMRPFAHA